MKIKLVGSGAEIGTLKASVEKALSELSLSDAVTVEMTDNATYKIELGITENPALAIEEESIDFKDVIFQGEIPEFDEIKSMFISILGDDTEGHGDSCGTGGCGDCGGGCH